MPTLEFKLPDVGEGVAEAEIAGWHVKPGDTIKEDQPFVDVMTDKATVEITSPFTGQVRAIHFEPGARVAIGSIIAVFDIGEAGGTVASETSSNNAATASNDQPHPAAPIPSRDTSTRVDPPAPTRVRPLTSPALRRRAKELGVSLDQVTGSGRRGRITRKDLEAHVAQVTAPSSVVARQSQPQPQNEFEEIKVIGLRRQIAERMSIAKRRIPHFSYIEEVDVTELERLRQQLNAQHADRPKLTVLPFLIRALVRTLPSFPQMNATFDDDGGIIRRHRAVHVGVATQTPQGLLVPVLRNAERLDLWNAARTIAANATVARSGKAARDLLTGSTITVTSLGALGGLATTPVINYPEVAIVGPNKIIERPVVMQGTIAIRRMMHLSSSFDHRVVDGFDAAEFIQSIKRLLETPALLFVEEPASCEDN